MMVLWILILLGALATEFAYSMRTEVNATKNYKEDIESYYLAKAGINMGIAELYRKARFHAIHPKYGFIQGNVDQPVTSDSGEEVSAIEQSPTISGNVEGDDSDFDIIQRIDIPLGNGIINYQISDENGKVNINGAPREVLVKALGVSGFEIGEERDIIADSILDWIDSNENHRLNGAESDYYLSLDPPYEAKNSQFDSLEELLKVRGITEEILYGSLEEEQESLTNQTYLGLVNFFTIQNVKSFNPNTADPAILPVFFSESQEQAILDSIEEKGYYNDSKSTHFRIESTGFINGSNTKRTIVAILEKFGDAKDATLLIKYWNDNALEP